MNIELEIFWQKRDSAVKMGRITQNIHQRFHISLPLSFLFGAVHFFIRTAYLVIINTIFEPFLLRNFTNNYKEMENNTLG